MTSGDQTRAIGKLHVRHVLAGLLVVLGAAVMIGWLARMPWLVQIFPELRPMTFATALSFLVIGVALILPRIAEWSAAIQPVVGGSVILLAGAMLAEHLTGIDLGVDLHALHAWFSSTTPHAGRMAPNTALAFILIGATLILLPRIRSAFSANVTGALIFGIVAIGLMGLIGYLFDIEFIYSWHGYWSMALATALGVSITGVALLLSYRDLSWYRARIVSKPEEHIAIIGAACLTVVALAAGLIGFVVMWQRAEENFEHTLTVALRHRAQLFQSVLELRSDNAALVVARPQLPGRIRTIARDPGDAKVREQLANMAESFIRSGFSGIAFYDSGGNEVARAGTLVANPALHARLKTRYESDLLWADRLLLRVRAPIVDGAETVGIALTEQDLPTLTRLLTGIEGLGETGDGGLCAASSERMLGCFPQRLRRTPMFAPDRRNGELIPVARAIAGQAATARLVDYRGKRVISVYGPVGTLGLGMSLKIDIEEIYAPVRRRLQAFAPLLIALIVAGALILRLQIKPLVGELVRSREDLAKANEAKDRFLANMSHELRTPLNAIIGFTGTLLMKLAGPLNADQEKQLRTVQSSSRHLLVLINDVLDVTKIEAGKFEPRVERVACRKLAEEAFAALRPEAIRKGLTFDLSLPDEEI
ncbi:MAG TPA: histidine kinase dimerization/phospho-acceptor domain-containing protein, partial [Burkholderiales bacterium]|nr:histidine kinase dimerization/phospho-acceptor domain-containing protein [Burkholderiales bacterium]